MRTAERELDNYLHSRGYCHAKTFHVVRLLPVGQQAVEVEVFALTGHRFDPPTTQRYKSP